MSKAGSSLHPRSGAAWSRAPGFLSSTLRVQVLWAVSRSVVQRHPTAWLARMPTAGAGNHRSAKLLRYAPPTIQLGRETVNALTFELDHPMGASQNHPTSGLIPTFGTLGFVRR